MSYHDIITAKSVFISHSTDDDRVVAEIRQALEDLGIDVWTDSQRLTAGDPLAFETVIDGVNYLLAVLSLNAINSTWVAKEIKIALSKGKKVIPLLLPGIKPSALGLWFAEEPVGLKITIGPGGLSAAMPALLAALGEILPDETVHAVQAQLAPIAELVLNLTDPSVDTAEGKTRATATAVLTYRPPDGGREVESKRYRFTAPLGPIEAEELTWYLERYPNWPSGVFQDRARRVEEALPQWGRLLYDTLNVDVARTPFEAWKAAANAERRLTVKVDRELAQGASNEAQQTADQAATLLLSLPWELIHDEQGFLFQGANGVRVRRSLPNRNAQPAIGSLPPIRVLLVSPRPEDESAAYIDHRASARPLVEALSRLGDLAEFKVLTPPTFKAFQEELEREQYQVVHFDGHGVYDPKHGLGALCFEDPSDEAKIEGRGSDIVTADKIAGVIRGRRVPLFFLDACQSAKAISEPAASVAGRLLECGVASVAAMSHSVLVETARRFVTAFYKELMEGKRVGQAMLAGQRALQADPFRGKMFTAELRLQDWFVPVLFQETQDPQLIRETPAEQVAAIRDRRVELALGKIPPEPEHSFVGRSRELLKAERLVLRESGRERYVVLQGDGGEGKTTLAAELARWLILTRRFQRGAFISLDQSGDARKVLYGIGDQLVPNFLSHAGDDLDVARQLVERALGQQSTVLVLDNMESVLPPAPGLEAAAAFDSETIEDILNLSAALEIIGGTRIIFTSREAMPAPFSRNAQKIGRLDRRDAIQLVGRVLGENDPRAREDEIEDLVEAVGCHARALVLIAGEVIASGVRHATEKLNELMASLEAKHPGQRERSLLASVELSLRRLPVQMRQKIRPLGVFQGGGHLAAIAMVLGLDTEKDEEVALARGLVEVGLAELLEFGYLRFDPALAPALLAEMTVDEREAARAAWANAMAAMLDFLYGQLFKDANFAQNVALHDLPNLIAALEHVRKSATPERVVDLATRLEALIAHLARAKALARVVEIRTEAAQKLCAWGRGQFEAERSAIDRLMEDGRLDEATEAARRLLQKAQASGENAYEGAANDLAMANFTLGRALKQSGAADQAIPHLDEGRQRFQNLGNTRMARVALTDKGDCLRDLGRYEQAAAAYEEAIRTSEELQDPRGLAVGKCQLATVRMLQERYAEALDLYVEVQKTFERLGEPGLIALTWHQIGIVHNNASHYDAAEKAFQEALKIRIQMGDRSGAAGTLGELGNLYGRMGRSEDAVRFYRQAVEIAHELRSLRDEGIYRSNLAGQLINLKRYDEARLELERAIECNKPFGHAAQPWKTFAVLSNLERAVGSQMEAMTARNEALRAYLAYRRAGGESETPAAKLCAMPATQIAELRQNPKLAARWETFIPLLESVLAGSRDPALAEDPNLNYQDAAELLLLIESLGVE